MSYLQDDTERRGPTPGLIAAIIVVALILVAGLVVGIAKISGGDDDDVRRTAPTDAPTASSDCGLPDGKQELPRTAPPTRWVLVGKIAAPESKTFGPASAADGVKTCFARNPTGALFAAATLAAEIYPRDSRTKAALRLRSLPGAARDEALAQDLGSPGPPSQFVGFKFEDYTRDRVTVTLATQITEGPNRGAMGATPMTLQWSRGDWRLDLSQDSESIVLSSLDGFIRWSGVA